MSALNRKNFKQTRALNSSQAPKNDIEDCITDSSFSLPQSLPLPKGNSFYTKAKTAELLKNLPDAEKYYRKAISLNDRKKSAIKDLASILHQQSRTEEALSLLSKYSYLYKHDRDSLLNLKATLESQYSVKSDKKVYIKISNLQPDCPAEFISKLLNCKDQIKDLDFSSEIIEGHKAYFCIVTFPSKSSVKKILENFSSWDRYVIEWVTSSGKLISNAHYAEQNNEKYRKTEPTFSYKLFDRHYRGLLYCLPLDNNYESLQKQDCDIAQSLIGDSLFKLIFVD